MRYRTIAGLTAFAGVTFVFVLYWVARITNAKTFAKINNCPGCNSTDVNPSATPALFDGIFRHFGCAPFRCHVCSKRYYRGGFPPEEIHEARPAGAARDSSS